MTPDLKSTRRSFMTGFAALGAALLNPRKLFAAGAGTAGGVDAKLSGFGATGNVYEELGVRPASFIAVPLPQPEISESLR